MTVRRRQYRDAPPSQPAAGDYSSPLATRINADGTVRNPPFYNSVWSEDSALFGGASIAVVNFQPVFNNVGNAHLVCTVEASFKITAIGVMALQIILQNPSGVNLLNRTFSQFDANPVSAVAPPANGGMNQIGQVGSSAIPITSITPGNWVVAANPVVATGAATVQNITFSRIEAIG